MVRKLVAAAAVSLSLTLLPGTAFAAQATHPVIQNGFTASQFVTADPTVASYWFDRSGAIATSTNGPGQAPTVPYRATTPCLRYTSEAQFASDIANSVIPNSNWPVGSCVLYDNEGGVGWPTPLAEQQDPEMYMPMFNQAAVNAGFVPITTPGLDLGNTDTTCPKSTHGGTNALWYENCHIAKYAVENSSGTGSGVVVQTQSLTTDQAGYTTLYDDAKTDAAGETAGAVVYAEVSQTYGTALDATNDLQHIGKSQVLGVFVQDTNADAGTAGGWEDTVLTTLDNKGW